MTGHLASCVTLELDAPYYNRDSFVPYFVFIIFNY